MNEDSLKTGSELTQLGDGNFPGKAVTPRNYLKL